MTALSYQKLPLTRIPCIPRPIFDHNSHPEKWSKYPSSGCVESHTQCLFNALCDVSLITFDLSMFLFSSKERERTFDGRFAHATENAYFRLRLWFERLPDCLGTNNAPPHVLSLQYVVDARLQNTVSTDRVQPQIPHYNTNYLRVSQRLTGRQRHGQPTGLGG